MTADDEAPTSDHAGTVLPDGSEQCLACHKPWPCPDAPATLLAADSEAPITIRRGCRTSRRADQTGDS